MRNIKYVIFGLFIFVFLSVNCYAAPITCERDENNLRLPHKTDGLLESYPDAKESVLKTPCVDPSQKIYDFVDKLSEKEEKNLKKELLKYKNKTEMDSVIVITNDISDFTLSSYAHKFYEYNEFSKDGIIFVLYFDENNKSKIYMGSNGNPGDEIFTIYRDARVNAILKYLFEHNIKDKDYYEACKNFVILTSEMYDRSTGNYEITEDGKVVVAIPWIECLILSLSISFIIFVLYITKYNVTLKRNNTMLKNSINNENMIIKCEYDKPIVDIKE